ncbi:E3 ubiquitin-protein ligase TRIM35-like [Rhinichthys klamathensis goyatoka]|uniref:E3 ubiquitin-protein ligase TRIM35-like n=1 Tax=Rhinichthys klamathensis goyatoka TaxID=3034132 RepID=UPI0024B5A99F|nr:E3 ubiquitin-protein ligase TRIM35-like [Rhinichthys klamathensis goyatoka]
MWKLNQQREGKHRYQQKLITEFEGCAELHLPPSSSFYGTISAKHSQLPPSTVTPSVLKLSTRSVRLNSSLRSFISFRDEEEATITALKEEEEQKKQMMKEKLEEMNTHISDLSHTIKDMEEMMKANDVCFLKEFPVSMERVQISQPDPQMASGALIHVSRYLGNLPFGVWKKMQDIVQNSESAEDLDSSC